MAETNISQTTETGAIPDGPFYVLPGCDTEINNTFPPQELAQPGPTSYENNEDPTSLIERAKNGDEDAWAEILSKYKGLMAHVANNFGVSYIDKEEIQTNATELIFRHIGALKESKKMAGWVSTITRREGLRIATAQKRLVFEDDMYPLVGLDSLKSSEQPVDEYVTTGIVRKEQAETVRQALEGLPERERMVLQAVFYEEKSYAEISEILNMPVGSIGPTYGRALRRLAKVVTGLGINSLSDVA